MKVINSLIAVEVPRGSRNHKVVDVGQRQYLQCTFGLVTGMDKLPFPAEIIGLASEIDKPNRIQVMEAAGTNYRNPQDYTAYNAFVTTHSLTTTPTTDIIFLRKKL